MSLYLSTLLWLRAYHLLEEDDVWVPLNMDSTLLTQGCITKVLSHFIHNKEHTFTQL